MHFDKLLLFESQNKAQKWNSVFQKSLESAPETSLNLIELDWK